MKYIKSLLRLNITKKVKFDFEDDQVSETIYQ